MKKPINLFQTGLTIVLALLAILVVFPFWMLVSVSFSNEKDVLIHGYKVIPQIFDLAAYRFVFQNSTALVDAYKVTISFSIVGTALSLLLMALLAYMLTVRDLPGQRIISFLVYFTMLFSGGLVPTYIVNSKLLHLGDSFWIYILPSLINVWYVFMIRTFFRGIPESISEAAIIDGANRYTMFFRIILPLSKPALAAVALFTFLGKWNMWFESMLYITDTHLISLQYLLQRIMTNIKLLQDASSMKIGVQTAVYSIPGETARMAMAVIVAGPALLIFPFFQKYFVKGITVGSVKG